MTRQIRICGGAHTRFGRFASRSESGLRVDQYTIEKMFCDVVDETLADAEINPSDIDGVWVGSCSPGAFVQQELLAPLALSASADFRFKPMAQLTAACASGSAAFNAAADAVQAGRAELALVVGIEKMSMSSTAEVAAVLARCSHWPGEGSQGRHVSSTLRTAGQCVQGASRYQRRSVSQDARLRGRCQLSTRCEKIRLRIFMILRRILLKEIRYLHLVTTTIPLSPVPSVFMIARPSVMAPQRFC